MGLLLESNLGSGPSLNGVLTSWTERYMSLVESFKSICFCLTISFIDFYLDSNYLGSNFILFFISSLIFDFTKGNSFLLNPDYFSDFFIFDLDAFSIPYLDKYFRPGVFII